MLAAELGVAHAIGVFLKVRSFGLKFLPHFRRGGIDGTKKKDQFLDFPLVEFGLVEQHPLFLAGFVVRMETAGQIP